MNTRLTASTALFLLSVTALSAQAQAGRDSMRNHANDTISRETQHWHFDGKISTVNASGRQITIAADSIPNQYGGKTTLPYEVPANMDMARFEKGMVVNADLVVREKRTRVENLKFGPTKEKLGLTNPHRLSKTYSGTPERASETEMKAPSKPSKTAARDTGHAGVIIEKRGEKATPSKP